MPSLSCKVEKTLGDMILIMISANQFDNITNIVQITFFYQIILNKTTIDFDMLGVVMKHQILMNTVSRLIIIVYTHETF